MNRYFRILYAQLGKELDRASKEKRHITYKQKPILFEQKDITKTVVRKTITTMSYTFEIATF